MPQQYSATNQGAHTLTTIRFKMENRQETRLMICKVYEGKSLFPSQKSRCLKMSGPAGGGQPPPAGPLTDICEWPSRGGRVCFQRGFFITPRWATQKSLPPPAGPLTDICEWSSRGWLTTPRWATQFSQINEQTFHETKGLVFPLFTAELYMWTTCMSAEVNLSSSVCI